MVTLRGWFTEFNAVAPGTVYSAGHCCISPLVLEGQLAAQCFLLPSGQFALDMRMQNQVVNERSGSPQAYDTPYTFAIFQTPVNSYTRTDPWRLFSPDKGTWKEKPWLESAQVPPVQNSFVFFGTGQARSGGASVAWCLAKEK